MKQIKSIIIIMIILLITLEVFKTPNDIINIVLNSINMFEKTIFPTLFIFFILGELLINYGFVELVSELLKPLNRLFKINSKSSFILIMSIISGFPSNAKYTKDLYLNGELNTNEATKILMFSHFSNPLFILGSVSYIFLNNKKAGLIILIIHYFSNVIIGLIFRNFLPSISNNEKISIKKAVLNMHKKRMNSLNIGQILSKAILNSLNTLFLILGTIIVFSCLSNIILNNLNINYYFKSIISGFFEITQGINNISQLNIPLKNKSTIIAMILSFGGISVHMQVKSILSDTNIKYYPFFIARLLHCSISGLLVYFLFDFLIKY